VFVEERESKRGISNKLDDVIAALFHSEQEHSQRINFAPSSQAFIQAPYAC
jgi:hypothetical protein